MNVKALFVLVMLALVAILALVCVLLTRSASSAPCAAEIQPSLNEMHNDQSLVFAALSAEEIALVLKYLQSELRLPLVDAYHAGSSDNCIYYLDIELPSKEEVLKFLDHGGPQPPREALAVVFFGNQPDPNITEYVVGPLPKLTYHRDVTTQKYRSKISYHGRTVMGNEYEQIRKFMVEKKFPEAPTFLNQVFGHNGSNFAGLTSAPRGFQSGDRATWFSLFQNVKGYFLHPVGMEVLVNHSGLNITNWSVAKVFYNGVKNSLVANDMKFDRIKVPWSQDREIVQMKMVKNVLDTEDKAAFRLHDNMPRYVYFEADSTNKWGHKRGYRIQTISFAGDHLPESDPMERAVSWGRYKLAVTKRKEEEPFSTSIYNQNDPWTPSVAFADFIDNETIVGEDLVAWITTGFLHIPHAEDIPNTVTLGNAVGFLLRPYNYFDEDPSINSPDSVFFTSEQDPTSCDVNHIACLPKTAACLPNLPPFTYDGFQNLTRL
ncbi:membrane primary amine oxidase-like isoform X2 [Varanus komodoensis]|uniref:membrane primary amine oxidase-like isoform X2 n=1 Tax=Varanus komodoensis TaxID=61221 RepID=UPI001CF7A4BF|nr:membrane primary amine oxidase-like isoform X2 [Varanus komodoensis]